VRSWGSDDPVPRDVLLAEVAGADGLLATITERVDAELLAAAPRLRVVANYAVGYDNVDVPACTRRGVVVCNTPGVLAETTADLVWALLLAAARRVVEGAELVKRGEWPPWSPLWLLGRDVHHRTLGIVGLGQIGREVAKRARGFDMRVLYHSRTRRPELEDGDRLRFAELDALLAESDFVSVNVSLSDETRHLIGRPQLARMKPSAYLVNAARGPIVDQDALYEACRDGAIAGAALDVTDPEPLPSDHPLLTLPNVTVLPHVGSATETTRLGMGLKAARNVAAVLTGREPESAVNPEALAN
jgi:glyoxylate reductase